MTIPRSSHWRVVPATGADAAGLPAMPTPDITVRCHRRLRGPYSGAGALLREHVVPELLDQATDLIEPRRIEIIALAPELALRVPAPPWTLTEHAEGIERTRYYGAGRTRRLAHGITELLIDWARACHPGGVVVEFRDLGQADPTDLELLGILLRRCDPALLTILVHGGVEIDNLDIAQSIAAHARTAAARPDTPRSYPPGTDLAQVFIDSDGTDADPSVRQAYAALPAEERARRHTARADELSARGEATLLLGAIAFHAEHGTDAADAGVGVIYDAMIRCLHLGFYEAAMDLAHRGRALTLTGQPKYMAFTHKIGACLAYLDRGWEALEYFNEQRRIDVGAEVHLGAAYMLSMLYTRHLPQADRDEDAALEWVNTAIALADNHPDVHERGFRGAFMRNARALVELHRKNPQGALNLVDDAARRMNASYGPDEHRLHRSVLAYNRGLVLVNIGAHEAALAAFDEVIDCDPEYADYYFERAGIRRQLGWHDGAFEDYQRAISLSPPFFEVHVNRADMARELGDDDSALRDLDYALELEPDQVDSLINRADILLAMGDSERAGADIRYGLSLEPGNPHLLAARAALLADTGDKEGALASYSAALREAPDFAAAWANRAALEYSLGQTTAAVDDLDHAIGLTDNPALRVNRAIALQDLGEHERALADLEAALADGSIDDPEVLYRRGASRYATGDIAGARADWRLHLAACAADGTSPHSEEIRRLEDSLDADGAAWTVLA